MDTTNATSVTNNNTNNNNNVGYTVTGSVQIIRVNCSIILIKEQ